MKQNNDSQPIPQPLTKEEKAEFEKLKKDLFIGFMFVVFDNKILESPEYKRYDELLHKKMQYLAYQEYLVTNN